MRRMIVLLSGGLDSAVNLFEAIAHDHVELALTFDYGQKAAKSEKSSAEKLCLAAGVPHKVISLPWFHDFHSSSLIRRDENIPKGQEIDILSREKSEKSARSVWVPNRNGIFLNIAAGFAEALKATHIVPGFNAEEAETFPDNSQGFLESLNHSFSFSTQGAVKVHCFTTALDKSGIVARGRELELSFGDLWPCYEEREKWCGQCESCLRFKRALAVQNLDLQDFFERPS